jgi:hypothetical protein
VSCAAACGRPAAVLVIAADLIAPTCAMCALGVVLAGADGVRLRWIAGLPAPEPREASGA